MRAALTATRRLGVGRYGPEQVDFLLHRPVLDNTRLHRDFPGLPRRPPERCMRSSGPDAVADRVAVVTGAAGQIGRCLVDTLTARATTWSGSTCLLRAPATRVWGCDLTDDEQVASVVAGVVDEKRRIDLLIHSAGLSAIGSFTDHDMTVHRKVMDVTHFGRYP